jgi:hypothetical protein
VPLHGVYSILSGGGANRVPLEHVHHIGIVGALAIWRVTQGVYRFDPTIYEAVRNTTLDRDLPTDLFYRLPEWCVYIETPGLLWPVKPRVRPVHGMWAHLDWHEDIGGAPHTELRLVLDAARTPQEALDPWHGCIDMPLMLGGGTVGDALERVVVSGVQQARAYGLDPPAVIADALAHVQAFAPVLWPYVSLVLYLCGENAEIGAGVRPSHPEPVRTRRRGRRIFAAGGPRLWEVGVRIGAALRRAQQLTGEGSHESAPTGRTVRAHIRRAHWHTFLAGPRAGERERRLRWLPPIAVKLEDVNNLPTVIRRIGDP